MHLPTPRSPAPAPTRPRSGPPRRPGPARSLLLAALFLAATGAIARSEAAADDRPGPRVELRLLGSPLYRVSGPGTGTTLDEGVGFSVGAGTRIYHRSGHGLLLELQRVEDPDLDGIFDERAETPLDFTLQYFGYARRWVRPMERPSRAFATTLHGSLALGTASRGPDGGFAWGARVGVDLDIHFGRFFFGWRFSYALLFHDHLEVERSSLLGASLTPFVRLGFTLGPRLRPGLRPGRPRGRLAQPRAAPSLR